MPFDLPAEVSTSITTGPQTDRPHSGPRRQPGLVAAFSTGRRSGDQRTELASAIREGHLGA